MGTNSVQQMADRVSSLLEQRLKIRGKDLEAKLKRSGRRLPRRIKAEAEVLVMATLQAKVPKLAIQMDHERVARAYHACVTYLGPLGQGARLRTYLLDTGAGIALALVVTAGLVVAVMAWRGLI